MGASQLKNFFLKLTKRIVQYGTTRNLNLTSNVEDKILREAPCFVILPDSTFKAFWNILTIFLLLYVVIYVPVAVCFFRDDGDNEMNTSDYIDIFVDLVFLLDIFITFVTAYEDPETSLPVVGCK